MAELAGALGARYVVTGTLGKLGNDRVLQLSLFDVAAGQALERGSVTASTPNAVAPQLDALVARVLAPIAPASARTPQNPPSSSRTKARGSSSSGSSPLLLAGGITAAAGVAVAVAGGAAALVLDARLAADSGASPDEKRQALDAGPGVVVAAAVAAGVAVVGLAVAGAGVALGDGT